MTKQRAPFTPASAAIAIWGMGVCNIVLFAGVIVLFAEAGFLEESWAPIALAALAVLLVAEFFVIRLIVRRQLARPQPGERPGVVRRAE